MDKRFLLVENGIVVIHNENSEEIVFDNMEDYYRYCNDKAVDLSNIDYLFYSLNNDPNATDFNVAKTKSMSEIKSYKIEKNPQIENLIDNLMEIKKDIDDPFTGKTLDELKEEYIMQCKGFAFGYISFHYDNMEQTLMHSMFLDPTTSEKDKKDIQAVGTWVRTVMRYAYEIIDKIQNASSIEELKKIVNWNYEQFNNIDPKVNMKTLVS